MLSGLWKSLALVFKYGNSGSDSPYVEQRHYRHAFDPDASGDPPETRIDFLTRVPLTRPSSPSFSHEENGQSKAQSILSVLPLEVRQQIWEDVLGGHTFHMVVDEYRLAARYCLSPDPITYKKDFYDCQRGLSMEIPVEVGRLLCLLLTCKKIYSEAVDYLYSSNTFNIGTSRALEFLPVTLLANRINAIHSLDFHYGIHRHPPVGPFLGCIGQVYDEQVRHQARWRRIWGIVSTMQNLRRLHVSLEVVGFKWETFNRESVDILLGPIREVTRPETLVLSLPFPAMADGMPPVNRFPWGATGGWTGEDPWDELSCTIRRVPAPNQR